MERSKLAEFVDGLPSRGRYTFDRQEAAQVAGGWNATARAVLRRLHDDKRIVRPRQGFYVVVPPEYRTAGAPPASWYIHDLMSFLQQSYYVGLLTAAAIQGASHQKPQEFQVVTDRATRAIVAGRSRIRFIKKKKIDAAPVQRSKTDTGFMWVSEPAVTAFDLVRYPDVAGGWANIATVLYELAEELDPAALAEVADRLEYFVDVQRLGYLLELLAERALAEPLAVRVGMHLPEPAPLVPGRIERGSELDARWRLHVNAEIVPDL